MRKTILLILLMIWTSLSAAQEACSAILEALPTVAELCAESDSLCLVEIDSEGEYTSEIMPLTDYMAAEDFEAIETEAHDEKLSFALIHLPFDTETLTMLAFGNTRLENTVIMNEIEVLALRGVNLRASPSVSASVVGSLSQGQNYRAIGRLADNTWLRVRLDEGQIGWASAQYLRSEAGFAELAIVSPNTPAYLPMQAFNLQTEDNCSALLLISPQNELVYEVAINGLVLQMRGVALAQVADKSITVVTLAGENIVNAFGFEQIVAENQFVSTALSESGILISISSEAEIYQGLIWPYEQFMAQGENS